MNQADGYLSLVGVPIAPESDHPINASRWTLLDASSEFGPAGGKVFLGGGGGVRGISPLSPTYGEVLRLSPLTPGATYALRFSATDALGRTGYAETAFRVNEPPASGHLIACVFDDGDGSCRGAEEGRNLVGQPLSTIFKLSSLNWEDEDLPL